MFSFHRVREAKKERVEKRFLKFNAANKSFMKIFLFKIIPFSAFQGEKGEAGTNVIVSHKCTLSV